MNKTTSTPKLLPVDDAQGCVAAMKSLISAVTIVEAVGNIVIKVRNCSDDDYGFNVFQSSFGLGTTLLNFAFSYVSGCQMYSPMDPSDEYKELAYSKNLSTVSGLTDTYTYLWWIKSSVAVFQNVVGITAGKMEKDLSTETWYCKTVSLFNGIFCAAAAVFEFAGDISAGTVTADNSSFSDECDDKKAYLCDTTGYLLDDVRGIMDAAYEFKLKECLSGSAELKTIYIAARTVFALGNSTCMLLTAVFVNDS